MPDPSQEPDRSSSIIFDHRDARRIADLIELQEIEKRIPVLERRRQESMSSDDEEAADNYADAMVALNERRNDLLTALWPEAYPPPEPIDAGVVD